jgi:hypothetical protein
MGCSHTHNHPPNEPHKLHRKYPCSVDRPSMTVGKTLRLQTGRGALAKHTKSGPPHTKLSGCASSTFPSIFALQSIPLQPHHHHHHHPTSHPVRPTHPILPARPLSGQFIAPRIPIDSQNPPSVVGHLRLTLSRSRYDLQITSPSYPTRWITPSWLRCSRACGLVCEMLLFHFEGNRCWKGSRGWCWFLFVECWDLKVGA